MNNSEEHIEIYDAGDLRHVEASERLQEQRTESDRAVMRRLLAEKPGRAWLFRLLERCHVFHSSFDESIARMSFSEGERNIGLVMLVNLTDADPDGFQTLLRERGGE